MAPSFAIQLAVVALALGALGCSARPEQLRTAGSLESLAAAEQTATGTDKSPSAEAFSAHDRAEHTAYAKSEPPSTPTAQPRLSDLSGAECLERLAHSGIPHRALLELRGVETPVEILGPIGPVTFWVNGGGPLLMDCRLALALGQLSAVFAEQGISRARFSGAYVYRTTRTGRLSHHAHGLALDVHEVVVGGQKLSVKADFARKHGCATPVPELNRLACALAQSRLFEELLTPDSNADHYDHLHLAVARGPAQRKVHSEALARAAERDGAERKAAEAVRLAQARAATTPVATPAATPAATPVAPAPAAAMPPKAPSSDASVPVPAAEPPPPPPPLEPRADDPAPNSDAPVPSAPSSDSAAPSDDAAAPP